MRVRAELGLAIGALLAVQVLTSFGAIALLSRMSPAIAQIVEENLYSIDAVEEMLAALALAQVDAAEAGRSFAGALERARSNITEDEEGPALEMIERHYEAALSGDAEARGRTVAGLRELARINYASTWHADQRAQRLGTAGAWAAVLLGAMGFVLSGVAIGRLVRRVVRPLADLRDTVSAFRGGDPHRRCRRPDAPVEFQEVAETLDDLLDAHHARERRDEAGDRGDAGALDALERRALLLLLGERGRPTLLVDAGGRVRAANPEGLSRLDGSEEGALLRARLEARARGESPEDDDLLCTPLEGGTLCTVARDPEVGPAGGPSDG